MLRISPGLATCLIAVVTAGCGTSTVPQSGSHTAVPAQARSQDTQPGGSTAGCQGPALTGPTAKTLVITLAGNARTYCVRVGDKLRVDLLGTGSHPWLRPLVTGDALMPIPGAATAMGVTRASFAAVQPGRVTMTSVRPPCQVAVPSANREFEPGFPLPKVYPLQSCPAGHRFSVLVIVQP